jgi:RNA polymerase sigma-70 factor (ECF subfamily)
MDDQALPPEDAPPNAIDGVALHLDGGLMAAARDRSDSVQPPPADRTDSSDQSGPAPRMLSFDKLYAEHAARVVGLLLRLGVSESDVQDVAQDVFIAIHAKLPGFEWRSKPSTWIHGFCLRKASDYHRRLARRRETLMAGPPDSLAGGEPEEQLVARQQVTLLQQALASLPEKLMQVFVLYEVEQLPMPEVVEIVGCPLHTGYTWRSRAIVEIEAFLKKRQQTKRRP